MKTFPPELWAIYQWYQARMTKTASKIRFRGKLFGPAATAKVGSWSFLTLPKDASAKLPSRGMTTVEGTINGFPFRATLEPDGQRSHWLRVNRKMREDAGADAGDLLTLEIAPSGEEPEPRVPADLRKALAAAPKARALWSDITHIARRDWIHWTLPPSGQRLDARESLAAWRKCPVDPISSRNERD